MDPWSLAEFAVIAAIAAYAQTLTGFAFGLVLMGSVALLQTMPLAEAAFFVSILAVVNACQTLAIGWRDVARRDLALILVASLPAQLLGYHLLEWLAETRLDALKFILGVVVIAASLVQLARQKAVAHRSSDGSFLVYGALSGVMTGLFSTGGPPLVYHVYRQPLSLATIRATLVASFATAGIVRLAQVAVAGRLPPVGHLSALLAIPAVMLATYLARRYPPPLSAVAMRQLVSGLLFLSGLALAGPAARVLVAHLSTL